MLARLRRMRAVAGDRAGANEILDELRERAHFRLARHRPGETLSTTALVHEAYLRPVDGAQATLADRAHFLALASRAMRFVLVDHARAQRAQKRGGGVADVALEMVQLSVEEAPGDLLALNEALEKLARLSDRQGRLVEYRFFGGLTYEEIAEIRGHLRCVPPRASGRAPEPGSTPP